MAVLLVAGIWGPGTSLAQNAAADPVTIRGHVINGTAGATVPRDLNVTVVGLSENGEETARVETTSADGIFSVTSAAADRHLALTSYLDVTYSAVVDDPTQEAELKIYETTSDDSVIEISSDTSTVIRGDTDILEVLALMRVKNTSDRSFIGRASEEGEPAVLRYPVPQGAFDVNPGAGITKGVREAPQGFTSADPVLPGEVSVGYLYRIRALRSGWPMRRTIFYPTVRMTLLIDEDLRVRSTDLRFTKEVQLGEAEGRRNYLQYDGRVFEAGETLEADITYAAQDSSSRIPLYAGAILGAILLVSIALIVPLRRRSRTRRATKPAASEREQLIDQIAALDEAFESDSFPDKEYLQRRNEMKSRLEAMTEDLSK